MTPSIYILLLIFPSFSKIFNSSRKILLSILSSYKTIFIKFKIRYPSEHLERLYRHGTKKGIELKLSLLSDDYKQFIWRSRKFYFVVSKIRMSIFLRILQSLFQILIFKKIISKLFQQLVLSTSTKIIN